MITAAETVICFLILTTRCTINAIGLIVTRFTCLINIKEKMDRVEEALSPPLS